MKIRSITRLAILASIHSNLFATTCSYPPPCARIYPGNILFIGVVMDAGTPADPGEDAERRVHFRVTEAFTGISPADEEIVITYRGSWLQRGHEYLVDAAKGEDNQAYLRLCGSSGEIAAPSSLEFARYLRDRTTGKSSTSLKIRVTDRHYPVSGIDVRISSEFGELTARTGKDGNATFEQIKPSIYQIAVAPKHYIADTDAHSDEQVAVLIGTCPTAYVALRSENTVSGLVRDAKGSPVDSVKLDLRSIPESPSEPLSVNAPGFETITNSDGRFEFESVSPGRYYLGTNLEDYPRDSTAPRTYYPGQRSRDGAIVIEVKPGESPDNLLYTLPDFGPLREITLCVVDENGKPEPSARISDPHDHEGPDFAGFGVWLFTGETGCVQAHGYSRAAYEVHSLVRLSDSRVSDSKVVLPGDGPVREVLVLRNQFERPKPR